MVSLRSVKNLWRPVSDDDEASRKSAPLANVLVDDDGAAELTFPESTTTTTTTTSITPKKETTRRNLFFPTLSSTSPTKTIPEVEDDEDEDDEERPTPERSNIFSDSTMKQETKKRTAILVCIIAILIAIMLGIVFGTKEKRNKSNLSKNGNNNSLPGDDEDNNEEPVNFFTNNKCDKATRIMADGSTKVGIISEASTSTFNVNGDTCGTATFDGGPGTWYVVTGETGRSLSLEACTSNCTAPEHSMIPPKVTIFVGDCTALYCADGTSDLLDENPFTFDSIRGQDYYLYVQGVDDAVGLFEISVTEG